MKFDDYVNEANEKQANERNREMNVISREITVIPCGGNVIGRIPILMRSLNWHEPELYLYNKFGHKFYYGYGDGGHTTVSHRGYNVNRQSNGSYNVTENVSYGTSHRLHVAVVGFIDMGKIKNPDRYNILLREATDALAKYKELERIGQNEVLNTINGLAYSQRAQNAMLDKIAGLRQAFYEKIDELARQAQDECGVVPLSDMAEIRDQIIKTCRKEKSLSQSLAREDFISGGTASALNPGTDKTKLIIAALVLLGTILLFAMLNR